MLKLVLFFVLLLLTSCGGEEKEPIKEPTPEEVFLAQVCTEDDPCYPWQIDLEAKRYSFDLLKEMRRRFTKPEQLDEAYAWIKAQPKVILAELNKDDPSYLHIDFQVKGMTRMTFGFRTVIFEESNNTLDLNKLKLEQPSYPLSTKTQKLSTLFSSPSNSVFTHKTRFDRKATFIISQYQTFESYKNNGISYQEKQTIENYESFKNTTLHYNAEFIANKDILKLDQFKIKTNSGVDYDYVKLYETWDKMVDKYVNSWKKSEYIVYTGHGASFNKDKEYNIGKIKWKGDMSVDLFTVEDGVCELIYDALIFKYKKESESSSVDFDQLSKDLYSLPKCGTFTIYKYRLDPKTGKLTSVGDTSNLDYDIYESMKLDTNSLINLGVLPLKNQYLALVSCNIGEYGIPLAENSAKNISINIDRIGVGEVLTNMLQGDSAKQGASLVDLFKDEKYRTDDQLNSDGSAYKRLYKESSPGMRIDETMTIFAPGWSNFDPEGAINTETWPEIQSIEPKFNAQNKMTLDVPVYVVGPWDNWCDLNKADMKFFIEGQDVKVEKAEFLESTLKQPTKHRGQFVMRLTLNKPLEIGKTFELYAQYYYTSKAAGFCPRTDTVARARARVLDPDCPTWSSSAGGSTFAGNHASVLGGGGTDFYTLGFEILSRVTEAEEKGTGITGTAFLFLDGRAEIVFTDQNFYWTTETPLRWLGDFDKKQHLIGSINGQITQTPYGGTQQERVPFNLQFKTMPLNQSAAIAHCVNN